jgi:3,4-dihydroxy 2-butanone 4-phosphate synthase/GTP cyclohydrolase II
MHTVNEALEDLKSGRMVILVDDEDRENEGDLVLAATHVTPEAINFMAKHARGLICLALAPEIVEQLQIPMMTSNNLSRFGTAFTVSIEASSGITTGISAHDRARTILAAANPIAKPSDIVTPGHIFPLRAKKGGVLIRTGQTEGSVDLSRLAGLRPAAVICEIMNDDGSMARMPDLRKFSEEHNIKLLHIKDIIAYRLERESLVEEVGEAFLPTELGKFKVRGFRSLIDDTEHLAVIKGDISKSSNTPLVRVHSECLTGDVFGSTRCDCGAQLRQALFEIEQHRCGALIYLRSQEGRGIGLLNKIKAYALQDSGMDTVEANHHLGFKADHRHYGIAAQILKKLDCTNFKLLTNNPKKISALADFGCSIIERIPLEAGANADNLSYLATKRDKLGHLLKGRLASVNLSSVSGGGTGKRQIS